MSVHPSELAGLPEGGPASLEAVKVQLSIEDDRDDARLEPIVAAVNAMVRTWPVAGDLDADGAFAPYCVLGACMLAARLYRRKNSPAGVESFGSLGAAYVMRNDPDIAQLLQLGSYTRPQIG